MYANDHFCKAFSTLDGISVTKVEVIPHEILKILPQIHPISCNVIPQVSLLEESKGLTVATK